MPGTSRIINDIPQAMLDVAREAMKLGLAEVQLGFMNLGSEFPSPIEWALWLTKRESGNIMSPDDKRAYVALTASRGEVPTAYVGDKDQPYWDLDTVKNWLQEELPAEDEFIEAWSPVLDDIRQQQLLANWSMFEAGARNGWIMKHTVDWANDSLLRRHLERAGRPVDEKHLPTIRLSWESSNNFYNTLGHPSYRGADDASGIPVSINGWLTIRSQYGPNGYSSTVEPFRGLTSAPYRGSVSAVFVDAMLSRTAPWFVRVADEDPQMEEWVQFPEATDWNHTPEGHDRAVNDAQFVRQWIDPNSNCIRFS